MPVLTKKNNIMKTIKQLKNVNFSGNMFAEMVPVYRQKGEFAKDTISNPKQIHEYLQSIWNQNTIQYTEDFIVLLLNRANKIIGWVRISSGGTSGTVCDPKVIFSLALQGCASSIVLSHNHPSGNMRPSEADIAVTRKIIAAGKFLEIEVLDHLIISTKSYFSFKDDGLM